MAIKRETWDKFDALIEAAIDNPGLQKKLQYGTPAMKLDILENDYDLTWDELEKVHEDLSKIIFTGSLRWWFW